MPLFAAHRPRCKAELFESTFDGSLFLRRKFLRIFETDRLPVPFVQYDQNSFLAKIFLIPCHSVSKQPKALPRLRVQTWKGRAWSVHRRPWQHAVGDGISWGIGSSKISGECIQAYIYIYAMGSCSWGSSTFLPQNHATRISVFWTHFGFVIFPTLV